MYGYLADLVLLSHLMYVAYVVVGQFVIIAAGTLRREWGRNPWFRYTHLLAIGIVVYEVINDIRCPLTTWEEQLRLMDGKGLNSHDTFLGWLLNKILFIDQHFTDGRPPEAFFTTLYVATFVVVLQALLLYPPRWFRTRVRFRRSAVATQTQTQSPAAVA